MTSSVYEIFEIKLKPKEDDFRKKLDKANKRGWHINGGALVKTDGGLQYVLDLSHFNVRCFVSDLFPIEEGEWLPIDYPARDEIIRTVITELGKFLNVEINEIRRIVKHGR
jgi:ribosomal protein S18